MADLIVVLGNTKPEAEAWIAANGSSRDHVAASPRSLRSLDGVRATGLVDLTDERLPVGWHTYRDRALAAIRRSMLKASPR